jgi:hypothetical protein
MNWSYDKALALLRSWKDAKEPPTLIVELAISSLAYVTALGEVADISEDNVTLAFGRVAWGTGQITLPLRSALFTYAEPSDKPDVIQAHNSERMVGCLELRFSGNPKGGCFITEVKAGTFTWVADIGRVVIEDKFNAP